MEISVPKLQTSLLNEKTTRKGEAQFLERKAFLKKRGGAGSKEGERVPF